MITKKELREYRDDLMNRRQIERRIEVIEARLYGVSSPSLSGLPGTSDRGSGSPQEKYYIANGDKLTELRDEYKRLDDELTDRCTRIERAISQLPSRYQTLLRAYYVEGKTWASIAEEKYMSLSTVQRNHRRAILLLSKIETK